MCCAPAEGTLPEIRGICQREADGPGAGGAETGFPGRLEAADRPLVRIYMASTGKKYQNHPAAIRAWAGKDDPKPEKKSRYADLKGGITV